MSKFLLLVGTVLASCTPHEPYRASPEPSRAAAPLCLRVRYPYSVVDGGVESPQEFQQVRLSSPILAEHYSDVGSRIESSIMQTDRWLYASWRRGQSIFWTTRRVLVRRGEPVLTDGVNLIRGRCGNRLSEQARTPVASYQPPEVMSDTPVISMDDAPHLPEPSLAHLFYPGPLFEELTDEAPQPAEAVPLTDRLVVFEPLVFEPDEESPKDYLIPAAFTPRLPVSGAPEPPVMGLSGVALLCVLLYRWRRMKRNKCRLH